MTPAHPTIRCADNGELEGDCLCGGLIRVSKNGGDRALNEAMARHNQSLLHMKARRRWTLWSDRGLREPVETVE